MIIGLKRKTVKLITYNPKWAELFKKEKQRFKKTFGDTIKAIEHVGSTAIPGISAKPIIDINIGVKSLEIARGMKGKFKKLGYSYRPFVPGHTKEKLKEQELYVKGPETKRTYYIHVTIYNSDYWKRNLLFRNYLRKNSSRAKQYTELKRRLAEKYTNDRETYTKSKEQFINETIKMAKKELKKRVTH